MNAIIFGAGGQDGYYLAKLLEQKGYQVHGVSKTGNFLRTRLSELSEVQDLIRKLRPQFIFHLAANSTTRHDAWKENHETICTGTLNILESVRLEFPESKVFVSGSGLQFVNRAVPIHERDPFEASSQYAVSRIHSVYATRYYRKLGVRAYVGYFFNHDSPLRSERHISKRIAEAARRIANGSTEKLDIGDISVEKEWGYAPDVVKAIWTLVSQDSVEEAVIGTGKAYSIEYWTELCFKIVNKDYRQYMGEVKDFVPEFKVLVSDPSTMNSLGWKHETDIESLAKIMMQ